MKPLFSYYGGKQKLAHKIVPLIPKHTVYVEPFAGGAAVLFKKPLPEITSTSHYREVLNDLDSRIVNFYRVCRDPEKSKRLVEMLECTPYSREEHKRAQKHDFEDDVEAAWAWFVDIEMSFSNAAGGGFSRCVFGPNWPITFLSKKGNLRYVRERFLRVYVEQMDAIKLIETWDSPQTFFYVDPPYPGAVQGYKHKYTIDDFRSLCDALDNCKGSFLLSAYECGVEPRNCERIEFDVTSTSANPNTAKSKARTEVIWKRGSTAPVRPEIQKLYDSGKFDCFTG